ncbi:30S ribosomal protein S14 [Roseomonas sp. OT10]|uniref:30S ribosomal protein S14 n=1 Tax=Roseomonas cutis TaxID=2897332 RepID=UPI001E3DF42D|nr:30S ribosomal protein S14 [Roseomonas sp. OT10]UFN50244.1 30S ribosomal protein S14 [Roseomonas sp. OT10]
MAKTSAVEKNKERIRLSTVYADKRSALKNIIMDRELPVEERFEATLRLAQMPRNGAKVRVRLRCELTGRPRGNYRKFKLSRNMLRDLASAGHLPGVVKASW